MGAMEPSDEKEGGKTKNINDDVIVFLTKRSETERPRYTARLNAFMGLQQKRRRATAVRRRLQHGNPKVNKRTAEATEFQGDEVRRKHSSRSASRSRSVEPRDACGCRRRRRRRRRSCGRRRRRRRRSCSRRRRRRRRRSCRRRRRRSSSRRRRRRSCRRRRRRRRRRRC